MTMHSDTDTHTVDPDATVEIPIVKAPVLDAEVEPDDELDADYGDHDEDEDSED